MKSGKEPAVDGRAWVEVDLDAIAHNAKQLHAALPGGCELMAVVKAEAYGHGAVEVAARLQRENVAAFAVATLSEAIALRESGIDGEILVMGYTHPPDSKLLHDHRLTQLAVDAAYAKALDAAGHKLNVHIAVDTGMHRLGIDYNELAEIESVYSCKNLAVTGIASHFASSDSLENDDAEFTNTQTERFISVITSLESKGYDTGKRHIQASYGILNYPELRCAYARAGIALYGVKSSNVPVKTALDLKPALSIRARIAEVRQIAAGESVSYGRTFTAQRPLTLATVCIGYADGIPRLMSGNGGVCLIHGQKTPILGRICMDLLMTDVSGVSAVSPGDVATLLGSDGGQTIRCEDLAEASGTITNDILCRLGPRLKRVYI